MLVVRPRAQAGPIGSRWGAAALAVLLAVSSLVWTQASRAEAQEGPTVTASVTGDERILAGEEGELTVRATGAGDWGYNLAVVIRVPIGIEPVASAAGLPRVIADPDAPTTHQLWIWEDVADLPAGGSYDLTVTVRPTQPAPGTGDTSVATVFPVGSSADLVASTYVSSDPNMLPDFPGSSAVDPDASAAVTVSDSDTHTVEVTAIRVTKTEPSPEAELVRGVHDHTTVYTVLVENTTEGVTGDTLLVDWIPAGLEFLGCGAVDNTTVDPAGDGSGHEYVGSGDLTGTPIEAPMGPFVGGERVGCLTPVEVVTVAGDPDAPSAAVHTKVTWDLGDLPAGSVTELRYRAAVPLLENTVDFDGAGGAPTGASLAQTANLDNNNGASTRHSEGDGSAEDGTVHRNVAGAAGSYEGVVRTGADRAVSDEDDELIHAMDLAVVKSADEDEFTAGGTGTYRLELRTGEYASASDIVLTDTIPNGLCPLVPSGTTLSGDPLPAGCEPSDAHPAVTGATVSSLDFDAATGESTLTLVPSPTTLPASTDAHVITYPVAMLASYTEAGEYGPTTSLDDFVNHVTIVGSTTSIAALEDRFPAVEDVWDDSEARLGSRPTQIAKRVAPRDLVTADAAADADPCPGTGYVDDTATGFRFGDIACFELTVTFPPTITTRNPVVTDVLPVGLDVVDWAPADAASADLLEADAFTAADRRLEWQVGTTGAGGDRYVAPGAVLTLHLWTTVAEPAAGPAVDKPENLMKYRQENVDGEVFFLRDQALIDVEPGISLVKGVAEVDGDASRPAESQADGDGGTFGSNRDGIVVREGEQVVYRVDLAPAAYAVDDVVVWDSLPAGFTCADVSSPSPAATCADPGDAGFPAGLSGTHASRSVLMWDGLAVAAAPATGTTLTYTVTVPAGTSVSTRHINTASVISYTAGTNAASDPADQLYLPSGSLDTSLADDWNTPGDAHRDDSSVRLPDAVVAKARSTDVADPAGFNTVGQAVTGELIDYRYSVTVPAHTTVHDGVLSDVLPAGLVQHGTPTATLDAGAGPVALPADFTLESNGTLRFPVTYDNTTDEDHVFAVELQAYLADGHSRVHAANMTNTARFDSNNAAGGTALPRRQASATVQYVEPDPQIAKRVSAVGGDEVTGEPPRVSANEQVTYTLTVTNTASRPTSYDTVVTDCVPADLIFDGYGTPPPGVTTSAPEPGDGTNGCATDTTKLAWALGEVPASASVDLAYDVVVSPSAGGSASYVNHTEVVGHTLPENPPSGDRGTVDDDAEATIQVVGAGLTKTVTPTTATVGESVTYTVTTTLPADVNFYDARIVDEVPAGIAVSAASCTPSDATITCTPPDPASSDGGAAASLTWELGDVLAAPAARDITITYTGTVVTTDASAPADLDPASGDQLRNVAEQSWNTQATGGERQEVTDDATVTVVEPEPTIDKLVGGQDHQDLAPGDGFSYTVAVANVGTSTAYDVTVTDEVPLGVVVDATTISDGGVLTGADAERGGGTITWTLTELAVGSDAAVTFSYDATLAPSATLAGVRLDNTATVETFASADDTHDDRRVYTGPSDDAGVTPRFPFVVVDKDVVDGERTGREGAPFAWDLTVTNTGDETAHDVVVSDTLPYGWDAGTTVAVAIDGTAVLPTPEAVVGSDGSGRATLTWTLDELAAGQVATIRFDSTPTADAYEAPGAGVGADNEHVNTVTVTAEDVTGATGNADGPYAGDPADADAFLQATNVAIAKTRPDGEVRVGDEVPFTLTVSNTGDQPAETVVVTDTLPDGLTFEGVADPVDADATVWSCLVEDGTVTCDLLDDLAPGAEASVTVTARVLASAAPAVVNPAEVTTTTPQTRTDDDRDEAEVPVIPIADLRLIKGIEGPGTVVAGERIAWTVDVRNLGPSTSVAPITVVDTLPDDVSDVEVTAPGWDCEDVVDQVLTCVLESDLPIDTDAPRIGVSAVVAPSFEGTLTNVAAVSATTEDPEPDNDEDTVTTGDVDAVADLALTKSLASDTVPAGATARYRLDVTNHGPSDAHDVTIADQLPDGLTYLGEVAAAEGDTWTCADLGDGDVACELRSDEGTLPAGGSTWLEFDVAVAASLTGEVRNVATVSTTTEDPDEDNDTDEDTTEATVQTNLSVSKSHDGAIRRVGDEVTFTVRVTNHGPADAADVVVVDRLPDGLTFADVETPFAAGDDWDCTVDGDAGTLRCELGRDLPAAADEATEELEVTARVTAAAHPSATNVVGITTATEQTTLEDDEADDTVEVAALVDLAVVKTLDRSELVVGETGTYTVTVTNNGPTADPGPVTLLDVLPEGLTYVDHDGADCTPDGRQLACDLGSLEVGASVTVTIDVEVEPAAYPEVTNVAEVRTPSEDTDPSNDHDDETTPVRPHVAFSLAKEVVSVDGDRVTWRLTATNTGSNVADHGFRVHDELPDELTFVSATGDGFDCAEDDGEVTCTYAGSLAAGASATVTLLTDVTAAPGTPVTNVAWVEADGYGAPVDSEQGVAVLQVADESEPTDVPPAEPTRPGGGRLPFTGAPGLVQLALLAGVLLLIGTVLSRVRRRRG